MENSVALPEGARIDTDGVWSQILRSPRNTLCRPALFLDRDGVVIEDVGHLGQAENVRLIPGAADVIAVANGLDIPVVVVTNQSGIGRGLFGWPGFIDVQGRILEELGSQGASVDAVFACPHHPDAEPPYDHPDHPARKPNAAMLFRAAELLPLDLARSWIVGDRARDIAAGRNAGIEGALYVTAGTDRHPDEQAAALALADKDRFRVLAGSTIRTALTLVPLLDGN